MIKKLIMSMMAFMMIASAVALDDGNSKSKTNCTDKSGCCMMKASADNAAPATCDVNTCPNKPGCVCPQKASTSNANDKTATCDPKTCVNKPGCGIK